MPGSRYIGATTTVSTGGGGGFSFDPVSIVTQGLAQFVAVAARVVNAIKDARAWTISEQTLGERGIDQIPGMEVALFKAGLLDYNASDYIAAHPDAANFVDRHFAEGTGLYSTIIPIIQQVMTVLFGVRITNDEDLDALDDGADAYYSRPDKTDIPRAAVDRAVYLKQHYFPISTYNKKSWDLSKFGTIPYAGPIPGIEFGTLFNGKLPGGAEIKDGIVIVPGALTQGATGTGTGTESTGQGGNSPGGPAAGNKSVILWAAIAAAAVILFSDGE